MGQADDTLGQRFIRSVHGTCLRARLGEEGLGYWYVDMGLHCQTCEHWFIEGRGDKVVLRAYCSPAKYLRANPDGLVDLADEPLEWEQWTAVRNYENDTWSFLSHHGTWLSGHSNRAVSVQANCNGDEQFTLGFV